ncbi:hypothetical protein L1987_83269 [Smallanthus sonchifolius]|uniref:Uncharacterized protein n=1 Tax=Smallanthus sonchifolius TaxID=185202 RepID=A0ACB8YBT6_9ASTR|nr:hypothetical protein L1987_83269 [Smallanthus sonchifolius]
MARAFTNKFNLLANTEPEWKGASLQYKDIVDFLNRSRISYAISADPIVSRPYLEQFWETADHDCTVTPNVIRATVVGHTIAFFEDTIRRVLQFRDLATNPTAYPDYFVDGCWRQRMGYVGARDYASYKKMWVLDQWRYFAHVMIMCISSRKAGKDAMGHDHAAAMVGLSLNKVYNFSRYIFKAINDQINTAERFRFLLYPLFVQLLINDALPNLPAIGERLQPELSEHSDEQQEQQGEEMESDDGSSDDGDDEGGNDGAKGSDSEATESDSSDSDDASSQPSIHSAVEAQQQVQVSAASPDSASTPPSQQLYRRRRRPQVQCEVAITTITEVIPVIVTLPTTTIQASSSRHPDPNDARIDVLETQVYDLLETIRKSKEESDAQQAQINSLVDEVRILRSQRTGTEERLKNVMAQNELLIKTNEMILGHGSSLELRFNTQRKEHELMVKLIADLTKKLDTQGEKDKEKDKEKEKRSTGDEACHPVNLTKDDDKVNEPEAGPSGGEHQALAIVPISAVPMAQGESTHQEGGDTSGGDKEKSVAEVLKDLSDDEILYLEPDYSNEAQIDALFNMEEGEIDSGDDWDDDDEDVVVEIPKGDGEGEYELEDGEIFEFPSFEAPLDTGSVEQASNVDA